MKPRSPRFRRGQRILHLRRPAHTQAIQNAEACDQQARQRLSPPKPDVEAPGAEYVAGIFLLQRRIEGPRDSSENASDAAAMGAEKPAKNETQPVMNPQAGPNARVK